VEHARCAQCRNPIRSRQAAVHHARSGLDFHTDCWVNLHAQVQSQYVQGCSEIGVAALMTPYQRQDMASWLPDAAIDAAAEELTDQLQEMADGTAAEPSDTTADLMVEVGETSGPETIAG
jgi:hypothetical protein